MNLDDAVHSHALWKVNFQDAIAKRQSMDVETIGRDDCCAVGRWFHGEGRVQWGSSPEFQEALAKHRAFHQQAGQIAQLINEGAYSAAEQALERGGAYARASNEVAIGLIAFKRASGL